nr:MAG TPA: hypothetical protein [Bacteriophage sp.]
MACPVRASPTQNVQQRKQTNQGACQCLVVTGLSVAVRAGHAQYIKR